jgi:hypothetical protein
MQIRIHNPAYLFGFNLLIKDGVHFKQEGHASIVMEEAHFRHNSHTSFQLTNLTFTVNRRVIVTHVQGVIATLL